MNNTNVPPANIAMTVLYDLQLPIFFVLACFCFVMLVARCYRAHKKASIWKHIHILSVCTICIIHALYQIPVSAIEAASAYFGSSKPELTSLRIILSYFHFFTFMLLNSAYIYVLLRASFIMDIIAFGAKEEQKKNKQLAALNHFRRTCFVVLFAACIFVFSAAVTLSVLSVLNKYHKIDLTAYRFSTGVIVFVVGITSLLLLVLITFIFTVILITALKRSNDMLKQFVPNSTSDTSTNNLVRRIRKQKWTAQRYICGLLLYILHGILTIAGMIWFVIHTALGMGPSLVGFFMSLCVRVLPTIFIILAVLLVFWPWDLGCACLFASKDSANIFESMSDESSNDSQSSNVYERPPQRTLQSKVQQQPQSELVDIQQQEPTVMEGDKHNDIQPPPATPNPQPATTNTTTQDSAFQDIDKLVHITSPIGSGMLAQISEMIMAFQPVRSLVSFLSVVHTIFIVRPLAYLYLGGPKLWGYGMWAGEEPEDICNKLSAGVPGRHWAEHKEECIMLISRNFSSVLIFVYFVAYVLVVWLLVSRLVRKLIPLRDSNSNNNN